MVNITFIEADGTQHVIDVPAGTSVMQAATAKSIPGIVAECGGSCACGTCCVYVDQRWRDETGEPTEMECAIMEGREDPTPGRRLSCQIELTQQLDGLVVRIPKSQF